MRPDATGKRASIEGGPEGLAIVIPARRNLLVVLFLGVWLLGWAMGEITVLGDLVAGRTKEPPGLMAAWLLVWTIGGSLAGYIWLWMLVGKERILMGTSVLTIKRDILGLGWERTYRLTGIRGLRVAPMPAGPPDGKMVLRLSGLVGGIIAFDYDGKTIRFGGALDVAEAQWVVDRMHQRFAFAAAPLTRETSA